MAGDGDGTFSRHRNHPTWKWRIDCTSLHRATMSAITSIGMLLCYVSTDISIEYLSTSLERTIWSAKQNCMLTLYQIQ